MNEPCGAASSSILDTVATPGSEFYFHVTATPAGQDVENDAIDDSALPAVEAPRYLAVKSTVDRMIAAILMGLALPLMLLVSVTILIFDGRPIFFRQTRVGKNGKIFLIWKFRSMCRNAEAATGAVWSSASDPRITALGRWLRCSHLDELPQFFNVLAGDMNLIGPRPERPEFVRELVQELPYYRERLKVRPGITGLAQLRLDYDQSLADVQRKVLLDLEYIRTVSFLQDASILLYTLPYIAKKLLRSWKTDRRRLNNAKQDCAVCASNNEVSKCVCRTDAASSVELEPQFSHFPNGSSGALPSAYADLRIFTVESEVRAMDTCQQFTRNDQQIL